MRKYATCIFGAARGGTVLMILIPEKMPNN